MNWNINVETEYRVGIRTKNDDHSITNVIEIMSGMELLKLIGTLASKDLFVLKFTDNSITFDEHFEIGIVTTITILNVIPYEISHKAFARSYEAEVQYLQSRDVYEQYDPAEFAAAREIGRKVYEETVLELLTAETEKQSWKPIELADGTLF